LTPGRYTTLPNFAAGDTVILKQEFDSTGTININNANGIYYLDGTGFTSTGANIIMDSTTSGGLMIYNHPTTTSNSMGFSISGSDLGTVNLSALTSGPYAGMLLWQDRTGAQTMSLSGNGTFNMVGTLYAADALLKVTGGSSGTLAGTTFNIGSQYIS